MADKVPCSICGAASDGGHHIGDSTVFKCPQCGGYRLAGSVDALFEKCKLRLPYPQSFCEPAKKRRTSKQEPLLTSHDLRALGRPPPADLPLPISDPSCHS